MDRKPDAKPQGGSHLGRLAGYGWRGGSVCTDQNALRRPPGQGMLIGMNPDELQRALGGIVLEAGYLERMLRATFCALIGSKYAVVVASQMMAHPMIEDCKHIAKVHTKIAETDRRALIAVLETCSKVNARRNRVIHDTWATRPGDVIVTVQSQRNSHEVKVAAPTVDELRQLADDLASSANDLGAAVVAALGPDSLQVEDQLRQELGHDISEDVG